MPKLEDRKKFYKKAKRNDDAGGAVFEPVHEGEYSPEMAESLGTELGKKKFNPHEITKKIIEFGKVLTGMELYDYQYDPAYRIIYSVVTTEGAEISLLVSRQAGKTEMIAFTFVTLAVITPILAKFIPEMEQYKSGIMMGLFAPQAEQMETTYSRAMMRITSSIASLIMSDPEIDTKLTSQVNLRLTNGSFLKGQVASKVSKIESKTYHLLVVEEAQDVDTFICQKSLEPMLSAVNGTLVKIGTTGTSKNHYWADITDNKRRSRSVKDPRLVYHFEADYIRVIADKKRQYNIDHKPFHLLYEKDVEKKKRKWGEDADVFKLSYRLIWALDVGMFFTDADIDTMCNKRMGFPKKLDRKWHVVAGLDIAKTQCSTIMTIAKVEFPSDQEFDTPVKEIIGWVELNNTDYEIQHRIIMEALLDYNVSVLVADYTGVGKPVVDRLTYNCGEYVQVIPYTFSRPSKSDMWVALMNDVRTKRIVIPANRTVKETGEFKHCIEQMKTLQKYYEGSFLVAEKLEGEKDDYCDSMALMNIAGNTPFGDSDEVTDDDYNPLFDEKNLMIMRMQAATY